MTTLRSSLSDYLRVRRALGYKLERAEKLLSQYLDYLDQHREQFITVDNALAWATLPADGTAHWWSFRLSAVRGFAGYLHAFNSNHEVPRADLLPHPVPRATPYLYSQADIGALISATRSLRSQLRQETYKTLIGLLSITGMRVGEVIRLDINDVNFAQAVLTIRDTKFGKTRELPLHFSTVRALRRYLRLRDQHRNSSISASLFISPAGTRLLHCNVSSTFRALVSRAGLKPRSAKCRPRLHDLRHTFAVRTLLEWYRTGVEVHPRLPLLSTYLGHVHPRDTYWYLQAAPELLALAADRLQRSAGGNS